MTTEEIQAVAIASSDKLLSWMDENKKGRDEVPVRKIGRKEKSKVFSLSIGKRLFSLESIFFRLSALQNELDTGAVKVKYYDRDKGVLVVRPKDEYVPLFDAATPEQITVISDLRFLVERTKAWFEANGTEMSIPEKRSELVDDFDPVAESLPGKQPSAEQTEAIRTIFGTPFSYIWGAPGTGKTQFVLAYCALKYIRAGKKIGIVAPTNLSLEQVLRGVMQMTDLEEVSREKILRLGNPTKSFANEFPEVCEVQGIEKKIEEIDAQLEILSILGGVRAQEADLIALQQLIEAYPEAVDRKTAEVHERVKREKEIQLALRKKQIDVDYPDRELEENRRAIVALEAKRDSFWTKVKSVFGNARENIDAAVQRHQDRIATLEKEKISHQQDLKKITASLQQAKRAKTKAQRELNALHTDLVAQIKTYDWLKTVFEAEGDSVLEEPTKLLTKIDEHLEELDAKAALAMQYAHYTPEMLASTRLAYERERAKLEASSTAEREERAVIIAVTLDTYIGRYAERKMEVDHLFLDEAGYANQVKALTLFNHEVPITFLGDHMQLPPVCEISDQQIESEVGYEKLHLWAESALHVGLLWGDHSSDCCRGFYLKNRYPENRVMSRTQLTATHRFGSSLAGVLSQYVYGGNFSSANSGVTTTIRVVHAKPRPGESRNVSTTEAEAIRKLVVGIRGQNPKADYVILAPYRAQIATLGRLLPDDHKEERILTVHKSQGREWDTVIFSVANASPHWFTDTGNQASKGLNVINTAVSRAKKELIIVCNKENWGNWPGQLLHGLVSVAEEVEVG